MDNNNFKFNKMYEGVSEEKLEKKRRNNQLKNTMGRIMIAFMVLIFLCLALAYYYKATQYKNKFYEQSFINGIDVSGMTEAQVEEILKNKVEDYSVEIEFPDKKKQTLSKEAMKFTYAPDGSVKKLLKDQNYLLWAKGPLGIKSEYTASESYTYDKKAIDKALYKMKQFQKKHIKDSKNAYMKLNKKNKFIIVKEIEGNHIKKDEFLNVLYQAIDNRQPTLSIDDSYYMKPSVYRDDKKLNAQVKDLNNFLKTKIVLTLQSGEKYVIDRKKLKNYLVKDKKKKNWYYIDDEELKQRSLEEAANLAEVEDTQRSTYPFKSTYSGTIELNCADYGWSIDQAAEADQIYKEVKKRKSTKRKPNYSQLDSAPVGNSYLEVDIPNQQVFMYVDGEKILETSCVSGTDVDPERRSDRGLFYVTWKTTDHMMRGPINPETNQPTYESHINYGIYYNGGEAFHDASWRSEFGGSIYKYSGSHGCINLPYNAAKTIYENSYVGMPVIVFSY